jgi:hypothetical protein
MRQISHHVSIAYKINHERNDEEIKIVKLKISFGEETRIIVPVRQIIRTKTQLLSGTILKPKIPTRALASFLHEFSTKLRSAMEITDGYVNSTGFHVGVKPDGNKGKEVSP